MKVMVTEIKPFNHIIPWWNFALLEGHHKWYQKIWHMENSVNNSN